MCSSVFDGCGNVFGWCGSVLGGCGIVVGGHAITCALLFLGVPIFHEEVIPKILCHLACAMNRMESHCYGNVCVIVPAGHVVYEMCTGKELEGLVPSEQEYMLVPDERCKEFLEFIFKKKEDGSFKRTIKKVILAPPPPSFQTLMSRLNPWQYDCCYPHPNHHFLSLQIHGHGFLNPTPPSVSE